VKAQPGLVGLVREGTRPPYGVAAVLWPRPAEAELGRMLGVTPLRPDEGSRDPHAPTRTLRAARRDPQPSEETV
jgi:hypothetical protein